MNNTNPRAVKGTVVVDPKTGDKRIKVADMVPAKKREDEVELSLYQILKGEVRVEDGNKYLRLKPLTLEGLAILEELYADEGGLAVLGTRKSTTRDMIRFATVLANDGLPEDEKKSEQEIGRMLTADALPKLTTLIQELVSGPLSAAVETATAATADRPAGNGSTSSTGSPSGSGGTESR